MRFSISVAFVALSVYASAHAIEKRQDASGGGDAAVLNYALTLEHLEDTFYKQGLSNFSADAFNAAGFPSGTRDLVSQISSDEADHVSFLTTALKAAGATPVQACTYNFGVTDVKGFMGLAQVLEGVGVSAYLGAAPGISNDAYLEAAGSILTVEARHNAFIRLVNGYSPFPAPYDTPNSPKSVVSLAGSFFASCPDGSAPSIQPFPAATLTTTSPKIGSPITVTVANATQSSGTLYCAFASGTSMGFSTYTSNSCTIPSQNVTAGQVYGYITDAMNISDSTIVGGPFILELDSMTKSAFSSSNGSSGSSGSGSGSSSSGNGSTPNSGAGLTLVGSAGVATALVGALAFFGLA